jgi:hypothetical protein
MKEQITTRVKMDEDLHGVIEFMQKNVPSDKLLHIADSLPHAARLLWTEAHEQKSDNFFAITVKNCLV